MCWCCWWLHTVVIVVRGVSLSSESSEEETSWWYLFLVSLCLVLTTRDCLWEEVELLSFEVCSTLTLCLRMEVKFFSCSQKVFASLSIFEDMTACCSINVFKLPLTELSTAVMLEFWTAFLTCWFELIGVSSSKLLVSSSRDFLLTA